MEIGAAKRKGRRKRRGENVDGNKKRISRKGLEYRITKRRFDYGADKIRKKTPVYLVIDQSGNTI